MNKAQRKEIEEIRTKIEELRDKLDGIKNDEEEKHGNMPEALQNSEKGETMQAGIDALEEVDSSLDSAMDSLQEVMDKLDEIIEG